MAIGDFSAQSEAYRRSRPDYPRALIDRIEAAMAIAPRSRVADVGAGTGIMTEALIGRGHEVVAIEPNANMRALATVDVPWIDGTFEATGLAAASVDWAVAAQAFHWADPPRALPELWRVLRPAGVLTVLWNNRLNEDDPVVAWTREAITRIVPDFSHAYRDEPWGDVLVAGGQFSDVHYDEERHVVPMSRERYVDLWRSHNRLTNIAGPERFAQLLSELTHHLDQHDVASVAVPYMCRAWSVRRSDEAARL